MSRSYYRMQMQSMATSAAASAGLASSTTPRSSTSAFLTRPQASLPPRLPPAAYGRNNSLIPTPPSSVKNHQLGDNGMNSNLQKVVKKQACLCSPSTHPGAFRCSLHKNNNKNLKNASVVPLPPTAPSQSDKTKSIMSACAPTTSSCALRLRRTVLKNSLATIGGDQGELVKRFLAVLVHVTTRPSLIDQENRRLNFHPKLSRFSHACRS